MEILELNWDAELCATKYALSIQFHSRKVSCISFDVTVAAHSCRSVNTEKGHVSDSRTAFHDNHSKTKAPEFPTILCQPSLLDW